MSDPIEITEMERIRQQLIKDKPVGLAEFFRSYFAICEDKGRISINSYFLEIRKLSLRVRIVDEFKDPEHSGLRFLIEQRIDEQELEVASSRSDLEAGNSELVSGNLSPIRTVAFRERESENKQEWEVLLEEHRRSALKSRELATEFEGLAECCPEDGASNTNLEMLLLEDRKKDAANHFKRITSSGDFKYIRQFALKYGYTVYGKEWTNLKALLINRNWILSEDDLNNLLDDEVRRQKIERVMAQILSANAETREELLRAYLELNTIDDSDALEGLKNIIGIREWSLDNGKIALVDELQQMKGEIEIERFEATLLSDDLPMSLSDVDHMDGYEFEKMLAELFSKMGYSVEHTRLSGDQGADVVVVKFGEKTVIQAKRFQGNVGNGAIQEIMAAISLYRAQKGMVVTNSYYTSSAKELASANNIELIDRDGLEELINKHW